MFLFDIPRPVREVLTKHRIFIGVAAQTSTRCLVISGAEDGLPGVVTVTTGSERSLMSSFASGFGTVHVYRNAQHSSLREMVLDGLRQLIRDYEQASEDSAREAQRRRSPELKQIHASSAEAKTAQAAQLREALAVIEKRWVPYMECRACGLRSYGERPGPECPACGAELRAEVSA